MVSTIIWSIVGLLFLAFVIISIVKSLFTVEQGTVAVVTRFGQFKKISTAGLNFKSPFFEKVFTTISLQTRSSEVKFQAVTSDQANVYFKTLLVFAAYDSQAETIKNIAFKFASAAEFATALTRTIEGSIRSFVSGQKQAEILKLRSEIVDHVKGQLDETLKSWGFHLTDLQLNDITFDSEIMQSMSRVVASNNMKAAAENEGAALLITKTKAAEAEGNAIKIQAEAEATAAQLRGQGVAKFREEVAKGLSQSAEQLKQVGLDTNVIMFSMWTEAIKNFAEAGKGNVIFLDGSAQGMDNTLKQIQAMMINKDNNTTN
jgi:regulator of protease activity HflC (stomatin/prohibitin superfamily)